MFPPSRGCRPVNPVLTVVPLPHGRMLTLGGKPLVMGIVNVTPDSFSDGGENLDPIAAMHRALAMESEGAAIIDIGGESTRPGAATASVDEELHRVIPVIEGVRRRSGITISVDTRKSAVAEAALDRGADIINDVSALRFDPAMGAIAARGGAAVILMHMRGEPGTMQDHIHYENLLDEIRSELATFRIDAQAMGITCDRLLVDPGIGFGKTFEQNLEILSNLRAFSEMAPLVVGASRKAFVGRLTGKDGGRARMAGSLAAVAAAWLGHASIVRVHDVAETVDFLEVFHPIAEAIA